MSPDDRFDPEELSFGFSIVDEGWFEDPDDWDFELDPDDPDNPFPS